MHFKILQFIGSDNPKHRTQHTGSARTTPRQGPAGRRLLKRRLLINFPKRNKQTTVQSLSARLSQPCLSHETFAKFDLSVVYVPGKGNTVADCLSRWAYPAGKAWMDISSHGDGKETEEAKCIIEMEKAIEQEGAKCFVVMANRTDRAKFRGARVQAI